jgi:hypothetical protein
MDDMEITTPYRVVVVVVNVVAASSVVAVEVVVVICFCAAYIFNLELLR